MRIQQCSGETTESSQRLEAGDPGTAPWGSGRKVASSKGLGMGDNDSKGWGQGEGWCEWPLSPTRTLMAELSTD